MKDISPTLLVLAAGMGSRYGGLKQIDPVGPNGETIIDYSIYDALRAGFGRIVFVIRKDIAGPFKEIIGSRFDCRAPVDYAYQELEDLPPGFSLPPNRKKPWGTGHAILSAASIIREPFAAINADDFYGAQSFRVLAAQLRADDPAYAMVGFTLRNTLSDFGSVARGVCRVTSDGYLQTVTEMTNIRSDGDRVKSTDAAGDHSLTGYEIVSMNMWGFNPGIFAHLRGQFQDFLSKNISSEKAELYIPTVVNTLIQSGRERCRVLHTPDSWFGVTYREDKPRVVASIRAIIDRGDYPENLWDV